MIADPLGIYKFYHCCPKRDRIVLGFAESKGLESAVTGISD
jgi:hypothetical protein